MFQQQKCLPDIQILSNKYLYIAGKLISLLKYFQSIILVLMGHFKKHNYTSYQQFIVLCQKISVSIEIVSRVISPNIFTQRLKML